MKTDDPWKDIGRPSEPNTINARRISGIGSLAWGLYWAIDSQQQCLLILQHRTARQPSHRLPRLRGLLVEDSVTEDGVGCRVIIRLTDREQREVFHRFCTDVMEATGLAQSEEEAIGRFLTRTWRWHRLLRSGRDGRLSDEEQMGLIGELRLLETHLLPAMPAGDAVEGWVGPMGAPKDFQIGLVCVEAKARGHQKAAVRVSSIHQLDAPGAAQLFLYVSEVAAAPVESRSARTVTEVADRVRSAIEARDMSAMLAFEERLNAAGFNWEDDYSDKSWVIGAEELFKVTEGFPRVTPSMVPLGVDDVRYAIALSACDKFRVEIDFLTRAITGERDGS